MSFVDFEELKARVSIEDAAAYLDLELKVSGASLRGPCPQCKAGGPRTLVITPAKKVFYCFSSHKGGDCISLVAHVLDIGVKDAAEKLMERYCSPQGKGTIPDGRKSTVPEESARGEGGDKTFQPLAYLEPSHEAVAAIGFDPRVAEELGIGFSPKGIMRGYVAIPMRDERGVLRGYVGIQEAKLPKDFMLPENVVKFPKKAG